MLNDRMTTNELFDTLQALLEANGNSNETDLIRELRIQQLELEIQNRELRQTQQQLAHSRTRYVDLYDFSPVGYASLDESGRIEEINITGGNLLRENPHKLIGRAFTDFINPADVQHFIDHLRRCRRSRRKGSMELRLRGHDGDGVHVQIFTMPTQDVDRHSLQFRTAFLNITGRKHAEAAVEQSQLDLEAKISERTRELTSSHNLLKSVLDKAQDIIYLKNSDGRYLMINQAFANFIGRRPEDVIGKSDEDLFPAETARQLKDNDRRVLESGLSLTFESLSTPASGARSRWFQTTAGPHHDHSGKVMGVVGIARDITERRQREEAQQFLNEASAVLSASLDYEITLWSLARAAVPHLADACVVDTVQGDGSVRRVSAAHIDTAKERLLWDATKFPIDSSGDFGSAKVIRTGRSEIYEDINDSLPASLASTRQHFDALRTFFGTKSLMSVPLIVRGQTIGCIGLMLERPDRRYNLFDLALAEDLADRAAIALDNATLFSKEQEANRLKDEFLATVSHELRTPLTPILGIIYKLRSRRTGDSELQSALDVIERNTKMQARIVEDLLDISRITTGKLEFNRQPMELLPVVKAAVDLVRPTAEAMGIRLKTSLEKLQRLIWCDRNRIQQVIWNLLANAIKFTPHGGSIQVNLKSRGNCARLQIVDSGVGISPEFLPHIFEPFRQAGNFVTRTHGGLGVGLSIVSYIVQRHGGTVRAESRGEGHGATFTVDLPYA